MVFSKHNNPDYLNWFAVGEAFRVLCRGLRQYAEMKIKDFQSLMTTRLGGMKCPCLVLPGKKPNLHDSPKTSCMWAKELRKSHRAKKHNQIPWHQSDSSKWDDPNDGYWEIAKIFMSDLGSEAINVKDPSSTDSTGLLNLLYYCKHFNIQQPLIRAVRDWRNKWAHSPDQLLQDHDKESAFDEILNLLDDPELMLCKKVQDSRKEIEEVRTSDISILEKHELCILKEHWKVKEHQSNRNERKKGKKFEKMLKKLEKIAAKGDSKPRAKRPSENEQQDRPGTWSNVVILFIGFILGLFKNVSRGFRWFLLMTIVLQVGDKSMLSADTGCFRATVTSPISDLRFQEFNLTSYLNYKKSNFFGRKWVFRELEDVFESGRGPLGILVIGEPGFGKSAIMSELICSSLSSSLIHNNIIGYHLCDYSEKGKRNGARFVRNLVDQISSSIPEYSDYVANHEQIHRELNDRCESDSIGCFHSTIIGPLRELKNQPDSLKYLIIDGLDECIENDGKTSEIIEIVSEKISFFPTWLKFILSSRNWTAVTNRIPRSVKRIALDPEDERNLEDIHSYIKRFLFQNSFFMDRLLEAMGLRTTTEGINSLFDELSKKGAGNFLFIKTTLQYLNESEGRINLQSFPTSLYDTYDIYFKRHFDEEDFSRFKPLFEVLIAATSPLRLSEIDLILKAHNESYEAYDLIKKLSGILRFGHDETVLIYHQSFAEWLQVKQNDGSKLNISTARGHEYIADYLFDVTIERDSLPGLEELTDLAVHMLKSGVAEKYVEQLKFINVSEIQDPSSHNCILHELALNDEFAPILDIFLRLFDSADIPNIDKVTPAMHAASRGNVENLKVLIDKGIDVNVLEPPVALLTGLTPIHLWSLEKFSMIHVASNLGHTRIVELLIKFNVSCTIASGSGLRPMHLAARNGHVDIVKLLYKAGDNGDVIALHHAAAMNHSNVVSLLLKEMGLRDECWPYKTLPDFEQGTDVEKVHIFFSETALYAAVSRRHTEIVKLLLSFENSSLECVHSSGKTVLIDAVERNDTEMAEMLLNAGASTETVCNHRQQKWFNEKTVLVARSSERSFYNLYPNDRYSCSCGDKVLHVCAKYGFWEMAKLILEKNADVFAQNCANLLPVHYAVLYDHVDFVRHFNLTLLEIRNQYIVNDKLVFHASLCGSHKTLKLLFTNIKNGEFPVLDDVGLTPLHFAVAWSPYPNSSLPDLKICLVVLSENSCWTPEGALEVKRQLTKRLITVKLLVESQKDRTLFANRMDKNGITALHYAAMSGFVDALKYLVHYAGSDWKATDKYGNTPLTLVLAELQKQPKCFLRCYRTHDKLFRICNTTMYDSTVEYLIWLHKSKFKKCNLESANILATAVMKQMPLTLYTLLKIGLDLNCKLGQTRRPFLTHLHVGGQQISEIFKMFEVNVTVECNIPFRESELHLISHGRLFSDVGNFFTPSVNNRSFPFQRLAFVQHKGYRIFDECRDQNGYLAIHRAAEGGNSHAIQWLINVGVDTSLQTTSGLTALDLSLFYLENGEEMRFESLLYEEPGVHATFNNTQRILVLEELLAESLKAISYDWHSSWCNPKLDKLSPLHIAATKGIHELNVVYEKAQTIVPDLSLDCYNKDGVGPLYLAYFYESVQEYSIFGKFTSHKIDPDRVSLQYPDREVEYQIIYNRFYKAPTYFDFYLATFRLYVDEITNCPGFYSLVPNKKMLDRNYQCWNISLDLVFDILNVLPVYLHDEFLDYYNADHSYESLWFSVTIEPYSWVKYHLGKSSSFLPWLRVSEQLKYHKNCTCLQIMKILQLVFTSHPRNVREVDKFTWERMGWDQNSTLDDEKRRWPFYFLFKKAMGEYKSYEYLNILNKGLDLNKLSLLNDHTYTNGGIYDDVINGDDDKL